MKFLHNFFNSKKFKDFQRVLDFGKSKCQLDLYDLRHSQIDILQQPVFFLSTGRCGTAWLTELLRNEPLFKVFHDPLPALRVQSKLAYELNVNSAELKNTENTLLKEIFLAGREELFLHCAKAQKRPVITDSRTSFFAQQLLELYPNAKFVHLHRHPGEFVRSGIRRSWYEIKNQTELSRIQPTKVDPNFEDWQTFNSIQKISWLWMETNRFISEFSKLVPEKNFFESSFNNWSELHLADLLDFLGSDISQESVKIRLNTKINAQKGPDFPNYNDWKADDKNNLKAICGKLAKHYGYKL